MSQFYVPDEASANKCHGSRNERVSITISGVDALKNTVNLYTGVVQSVEDHGAASVTGRRWRVTMLDAS
jgi:hypothetical protein